MVLEIIVVVITGPVVRMSYVVALVMQGIKQSFVVRRVKYVVLMVAAPQGIA